MNTSPLRVRFEADLRELVEGFSGANEEVRRVTTGLKKSIEDALVDGSDLAGERMQSLVEDIDETRDSLKNATDPMAGLAKGFKDVAEAAKVGKEAMDDAGRAAVAAGQSFAGAGAGARTATQPIIETGEAARKTRSGFLGVLDTLVQYRQEQVRQGRMARFFANELTSILPAAAGASTGLRGFLGLLIEGAVGGLSFGFALEAVKLAFHWLSTTMNKSSEEAKAWADIVTRHTLQARDAWRDFYESLESPQLRAMGVLRRMEQAWETDIRAQEKIIRDNDLASGWSKFWQVITPGDDHFQRMEKAHREIWRLKGLQAAEKDNPEVAEARRREVKHAEEAIQRELITITARGQSERFQIEAEWYRRVADMKASTPPEIQATKAFQDKLLAMEEEKNERLRALTERFTAERRAIQMRAALIDADAVTRIDEQARAARAEASAAYALAERHHDTEAMNVAEMRIALANTERNEALRALREQQAEAANALQLERALAQSKAESADAEPEQTGRSLALQTAVLAAFGVEREAILRRMTAQVDEATAVERANVLKIRAAEEAIAMAKLEFDLQHAIRQDKEGSNQAEIDLIFQRIIARQEDYEHWKKTEAAKRGDEDAARDLERRKQAQGPAKKENRDAIRAAREAYDAEYQMIEDLHTRGLILEDEYRARLADASERYYAVELANMQGFAADAFGVYQSMTQSIAQNWGLGIQQMIDGGYRFQDFWRNLWLSVARAFSQAMGQMFSEWVATLARKMAVAVKAAAAEVALTAKKTATVVATEQAEADAVVSANAAKAATGAGASQSSIPWIGPALAIAAMAAMFAAVMAYKKKSAAGGYDIPAGVNPLVQAHGEEMVLPANVAKPLRGLLARMGPEGDGAPQNAPLPVQVTVQAMDGASVMRVLNSNEGKAALLRAVQDAQRDGRLGR